MRSRGAWTSGCIAALVLAIAGGMASLAHATHVACGAVITTDTTLDSDLRGCRGNGVTIGAGGVTLDLAGHTVEGTGGAGLGVATAGNVSHVTVKNGRVGGFRNAIVMGSNGTDYVVRNATVYGSHDGVLLISVARALVERVNAFGNDGSGITAPRSREVTYRRNHVHDNAAGMGGVGLEASTIERNVIERNTFYGARFGAVTDSLFQRNVVSANGEFGIALEDGSTGNRVVRNRVSRTTGNGIFLAEDSGANTLRRNRSDRNTVDGFAIMGAGATLIRNTAVRNGALGFNAPLGAALARHNEARRNADRHQCAGIPC